MEVHVGETFRKRLIVFYIPLFICLVLLLLALCCMLMTSLKADFELYNAWNTLWIATVSTTISLCAGVLARYALSHCTFLGSTSYEIMIFITSWWRFPPRCAWDTSRP